LGAVCCGVSVEALELAFAAPIPGVIGPRSFSPFEGCGLGASGTACWSAGCCANEAPTLNPEIKTAASARAFKPRSTGILSSQSQPCASRFPGSQMRPEHPPPRLQPSDYQTHQHPAGCPGLAQRVKLCSPASHRSALFRPRFGVQHTRCVSPAISFFSPSSFRCSRRQPGDNSFHRPTLLLSVTRRHLHPKKSPWEPCVSM